MMTFKKFLLLGFLVGILGWIGITSFTSTIGNSKEVKTTLEMDGNKEKMDIPILPKKSFVFNKALKPYLLGKPVGIENLVVIPILSCKGKPRKEKYMTLDEALTKKLVIIKEEKQSSVPILVITSQAAKQIFIPFGSMVSGGKQDRMTAEDIVLYPQEQRKIKVFCVEQGRWAFGKAGTSFARRSNIASYAVRGNTDQDEVWNCVGDQNTFLENSSVTGNFQEIFDTSTFKKSHEKMAVIEKKVAVNDRVVGIIVVINGEVQSVEIFATPLYFRKVWKQIFSACVIDATSRDPKKSGNLAIAYKSAAMYLERLANATIVQRKVKNQIWFTIQGKKTFGNAIVETSQNALVYFRLFLKNKPSKHQQVYPGIFAPQREN